MDTSKIIYALKRNPALKYFTERSEISFKLKNQHCSFFTQIKLPYY